MTTWQFGLIPLLVACGDNARSVADARVAAIDGAPDAATWPCNWTVVGGAGMSEHGGTCTFEASAPSGVLQLHLTNGGDLRFTATIAGQTTLAAGTYATGDATGTWLPHTGYEVPTGWAMCMGSPCTATNPAQGSFSLAITDPGPELGGVWDSATGSLMLVLPPAYGTAMYNTASVTATFP